MLKLLFAFAIAGLSLYLIALIPGAAVPDLAFLKNPLVIIFPIFTVPGLITGWLGDDWWLTALCIAAVLQLGVIGWTMRLYHWIKNSFRSDG